MSFVLYDISFLVLFAIFVSWFLYRGKKNIKKEGLLLLYKTNWGIKFIEYVGDKYQRTLKILAYVSIVMGYLLMGGIIYLFGKIVYLYVALPEVVQAIKIPPIMPLIPYLPTLFKLDFLPPFYFTYWIVILAIIAIPHEFAHGIFARLASVKIKSTGFGFFPFFLPVFLAAFVEQDDEQMNKKNIFEQLSILSAGTFANVLTAILFFVVMILFYSLFFVPSGIIFDGYPMTAVSFSNITSINGIELQENTYQGILDLLNEEGFNEIKVNGNNFVAEKNFIELQNEQQGELFEKNYLIVYDDAPAIKAGLTGTITKINSKEIKNLEEFEKTLKEFSPGEKVTITTLDEKNSEKEYEIILGENPSDKEIAWLGVGFYKQESSGLMNKIYSKLSFFKKPNVSYISKIGNLGIFIYELLWWIILISISVALVNMLPFGIFDGGRFFYLTILAIFKKERTAKIFYSAMNYLFLFLILLIMFFWAISFF